MNDRCFICNGSQFKRFTPPYRQCLRCGHETRIDEGTQTYMLNEALSVEGTKRTTALDRFQDIVLDRFRRCAEGGQWIDIGSGSGKLLYRNRHKFAQHCGIEITPAAVEYSRRELGLNVVTDSAQIEGGIAFATAWHSLEHFPIQALTTLLAELRTRMKSGARIIVSVPNGASFQYQIFRRHYAFSDVANHLHQFTPDSLQRLFAAHGFKVTAPVVSWPYNLFGYAQALLNLVLSSHNYLYYRLKRGAPSRSKLQDIAGFLMLPFVLPLSVGLCLLDATCPSRQGVLTYCFERDGAQSREAT